MVMTCMFYSVIIPTAIPLAMIATLISYWVTKYYMLRRYKMPDMLSKLIATFFSNLMPWFICFWSFWALNIININSSHFKTNIISIDSFATLAGAFLIAFFCMCLPIRSCLIRIFNKKIALNKNKTYKSLVLTFLSDYDKENPLTMKAG